MSRTNQTYVTPLRLKTKQPSMSEKTSMQQNVIDWNEIQKAPRGSSMLKNLSVASVLVLCAVTLRTGAVPQLTDAADAVLTAATDNSLLDEKLGKLSFVSTLFPEAVLVFGEQHEATFAMPVSTGSIVHAWSSSEPYMAFRTNSSTVVASSDGEVIGVYHGNGNERLIQVMGEGGYACLYGNLNDVAVETGDYVHAGDYIGSVMNGADLVFEVRQDGLSIDPARYFSQ